MRALFIFLLLFSVQLLGQDILNDLATSNASPQRYEELFQEKVLIISNSRRIFILSNENQKFTKGDFVSLLLNRELGVRGLVAKVEGDKVGIKVIKIYSLALWSKMKPGTDVDIILGDDSYFQKAKEEKEEDLDSIKDESDLFNDDLEIGFDEDDENDNRALKTDNIVSLAAGNFPSINADRVNKNHFQWSISWAHQISKNIYLEGMFGYTKIENFPAKDGSQTVVSKFGLRAKYNFKAPLYIFVMPFIGIENIRANSPDAGQNITNQAQIDNELSLVSELVPSNTNIQVGVTLLRRLVPAWFVKGELYFNSKGKLHYEIGFAIEF